MLHLLLGTSKTGKTTEILAQIGDNSGKRPQILIVPEQYSHETEQRLCREQGNQKAAGCEVLSFTRLANRVLTEAGGLAEPVLDGGGRLLLMHEAVKAASGALSVYAKPSQKVPFLQQLLATADELKSYCVPPEQLLSASAGQSGEDGERLHDLGLILGTYDALVSERAADPRDLLTRVAAKLGTCSWARGKDFYLDCFTDFTPQQKGVLERLLKQGHSVTVVLTCDTLETDGLPVYAPYRRTAFGLLEMARKCGAGADYRFLTGRKDGAPQALAALENGLFQEDAGPVEGPQDAVGLLRAKDPYAEVEMVAGRIRALVREQGYRYRDIAVSARVMEGYGELIEAVFRRYEIPVFLGRMDDILEKPVLTLLTSALEAVNGGYEYDDMFRYLKTGLAGVEMDDVDRLENYVLRWDIRGSRWSQGADWDWHPEGYGLEWKDSHRETVRQLDALRRRIIAPLEELKSHPDAPGRVLAEGLYRFLEAIQLPERLTQRATVLQERGELTQAEEYRQIWDVLCDAMEQCARLMGPEEMKLADFANLFRLILSQYRVGSIPVALDRVAVGEMQRIAHKQARVLFLLGVDDAHFPMVTESQGLLTDEDRKVLTELGCELAPSADARLDREETMAHDAVAIPSEKLFLSWPEAASDGGVCRPAWMVNRAALLLRGVRIEEPEEQLRYTAPIPALDAVARMGGEETLRAMEADPHWQGQVRRIRQARNHRRGHLSREAVGRLYGREVRMSASRMDVIKSCHFRYFMQYGLRAKARKAASFDAPAMGTFVHAVLESVLREARDRGGVRQQTEETLRALTDQAIETYLTKDLGGFENKSQRFRYLFQRLKSSVHLIVQNVVEELRASQFEPIAFELGFGDGEGASMPPVQLEVDGLKLSITGFVDRVDGWVQGDRLYLRVVDYKTGKKSFSLTDVWHGLEMQMLLYLFTLEERGEERGSREVVPAGVLYLPARDMILPGRRDMSPEERRRAADKALVRSGMLLKDRQVLDAMETVEEGSSGRFLPIRITKKSVITGKTLATAEQWGIMHRHVHEIIREIGQEMAKGIIAADPYQKGRASPCDYCDYQAACQFEDGQAGESYRYLYSVEGEDFWENAKGTDSEAERRERHGNPTD